MSSACVARRQDKKKKGSACGTLSTSKSSCPLREEKTHTMVFHATKRTRDTHHMMMHTHAHTHSRRRRGRRGPAREIRRRRNDDWRARVAPRLRPRVPLMSDVLRGPARPPLNGSGRVRGLGGGTRGRAATNRTPSAPSAPRSALQKEVEIGSVEEKLTKRVGMHHSQSRHTPRRAVTVAPSRAVCQCLIGSCLGVYRVERGESSGVFR